MDKVAVAVSEHTYSLTKKLYFFPGLKEIRLSREISQPSDT